MCTRVILLSLFMCLWGCSQDRTGSSGAVSPCAEPEAGLAVGHSFVDATFHITLVRLKKGAAEPEVIHSRDHMINLETAKSAWGYHIEYIGEDDWRGFDIEAHVVAEHDPPEITIGCAGWGVADLTVGICVRAGASEAKAVWDEKGGGVVLVVTCTSVR